MAENTETGMAAIARASGGSLCVLSNRPPPDFDAVRLALRDPMVRVQLIVCLDEVRTLKPHHVDTIVIPELGTRTDEVPRIVAEYAKDAAAELGATTRLGDADQTWILEHSAASISEIEKGTRRLVALRQHSNNINAAANALGMARISLFRWFAHRAFPAAIQVRDHRRRDRPAVLQDLTCYVPVERSPAKKSRRSSGQSAEG